MPMSTVILKYFYFLLLSLRITVTMPHKGVITLNRIADLRKAEKLSQAELANILHVSYSAVSQWETGKTFPDAQNLRNMATHFQVTMDYIMGADPKNNPPPTNDEMATKIKKLPQNHYNLVMNMIDSLLETRPKD